MRNPVVSERIGYEDRQGEEHQVFLAASGPGQPSPQVKLSRMPVP